MTEDDSFLVARKLRIIAKRVSSSTQFFRGIWKLKISQNLTILPKSLKSGSTKCFNPD